jgi:hypothetical protein
MRLPSSPYRVPARKAGGAAEPTLPADPVPIGVLAAVLACSLIRFGLFAFGPERAGLDPVLALVAAAASAYYLKKLRGR